MRPRDVRVARKCHVHIGMHAVVDLAERPGGGRLVGGGAVDRMRVTLMMVISMLRNRTTREQCDYGYEHQSCC